MNGQVTARREELINASHAAQLAQHSEQFQKLIPLLVSSMKIYVSILEQGKTQKYTTLEHDRIIMLDLKGENLKTPPGDC